MLSITRHKSGLNRLKRDKLSLHFMFYMFYSVFSALERLWCWILHAYTDRDDCSEKSFCTNTRNTWTTRRRRCRNHLHWGNVNVMRTELKLLCFAESDHLSSAKHIWLWLCVNEDRKNSNESFWIWITEELEQLSPGVIYFSAQWWWRARRRKRSSFFFLSAASSNIVKRLLSKTHMLHY